MPAKQGPRSRKFAEDMFAKNKKEGGTAVIIVRQNKTKLVITEYRKDRKKPHQRIIRGPNVKELIARARRACLGETKEQQEEIERQISAAEKEGDERRES